MDAARGDAINLNIKYLRNVKIILGLSKAGFTKDGLNKSTYLFT
jgi:hypothetical protein